MSKVFMRATLVAAVIGAAPALAADISGAGATFPYPIYAKWADTYKTQTGNGLNYQSIGSGGGIKQIIANTVTFGATDKPLKAEDLAKNGLVQWPQVMGGIVPIINLEGVGSEQLVLDGYGPGENLPRRNQGLERSGHRQAEPEAQAPGEPRSRSCTVRTAPAPPSTSPTTSRKCPPDWKSKVGSDAAVEWPVGLAAKGNEGVANTVTNTKGSIGYVEYAYAKQNKIAFADLVNKDGKTRRTDDGSLPGRRRQRRLGQ